MSDGGSEPPSLLGFVGAEWRGRRGESRERIGWYAFDWANSPMFQAASAVLFVFFLSGIMDAHTSAGSTLETCAALGTCVTDRASFIRGEATCTAADGAPLAVPCRACVEGSGQMRYSPALEKFEPFAPPTVRFMFDVTAETFAGTVIAIASFVQLLVFITCGAWADFGGMRRRGLFISTACSCASLLLMLAVVRPSLYWLAGVLVIIATVCHGLALIYSNAYLPILVELHPAVAAAKASADASGTPVAREAAVATRELIEARVSSLGFMVGYAGGFICFAIAGALLIVSSSGALSSLLAMQIGLAVVSVWWLGFSVITWRTLGEHPGQPVPPARELITIGWRSTATLFARASRSAARRTAMPASWPMAAASGAHPLGPGASTPERPRSPARLPAHPPATDCHTPRASCSPGFSCPIRSRCLAGWATCLPRASCASPSPTWRRSWRW